MNKQQSHALISVAQSQSPKAKVRNIKDITKVLEYFRYTTGTSLDCAIAKGILRNSITWYIRELEEMGLLQVVYVGKDKTTGRKAKHYSADHNNWRTEQ